MNSINLAPILSVLKSAQADIEDLITVAGVDPHSQAEMLAENYEVQWNTLQELALTIQQVEQWLPTDETEPPDDLLDTILDDGHPQRVEGSGPPAQAFQQVWDQCEEHNAIALRRLQLGFYGSIKSHADSLAAVGLAIPQMGKGPVHVLAEPIYS